MHILRSLRRQPGFACVAVLTLALGIGANAAIFSVIDTLVLRPPPIEQLDRLVSFQEATGRRFRSTSVHRRVTSSTGARRAAPSTTSPPGATGTLRWRSRTAARARPKRSAACACRPTSFR